MTTVATARKAASKRPVKKIDITKLSDKELLALDERVYLASLSPKLRRLRKAAAPLRGVFDKELAKCAR